MINNNNNEEEDDDDNLNAGSMYSAVKRNIMRLSSQTIVQRFSNLPDDNDNNNDSDDTNTTKVPDDVADHTMDV